MKSTRKLLACFLVVLLAVQALTGCQSKSSPETETEISAMICPFSELTFDNTFEDLIALEGEDYETYASVYNGMTYTYKKAFQDLTGTIKYMYDDKEELMCIAWTYSAKSSEELQNLYDSIHNNVVEQYGESGYDAATSTNYGDVWYLDEGHIILSVMDTEEQKALQYSYQSPKASEEAATEE